MKAARMLRSCLRPFTCISRLPSLSRVAPASFAGLGLRSTGRHSSSRYTHPFACGSARYAVYVERVKRIRMKNPVGERVRSGYDRWLSLGLFL